MTRSKSLPIDAVFEFGRFVMIQAAIPATTKLK
jgi:hypothetical protein